MRISQALKAKYAEQMTIVVQHQFWDLKVSETHFEIGLSFSDTPERLVIPFNAIRGFYDPSVNFELEFDVPLTEEEENEAEITAYPVDAVAKSDEPEAAKSDEKKEGSVVSLDAFRKKCLMEGLDDIGLTLEKKSSIDDFESRQKDSQPWLHTAA